MKEPIEIVYVMQYAPAMPVNDTTELSPKHASHELFMAVREGKLEDVITLLDAGEDVNAAVNSGENLLFTAVINRHTPVALYLISRGIDIHRHNDRGNTVLIWAAMMDNAEIVRVLLEKGVDPAAKNMQGNTALSLSKDKPAIGPEVVRLLEDALEKIARAEKKERERILHESIAEKQRLLKEQARRNKMKIGF
jgi:ankyrin repeat protein